VTCAPAERGARAVAEPGLIIEVLSPSTAAHDRGVKLADYRKLATVEQILLVASEDRHVEVWRREQDGWNVQDLIGDAAVPLAIDGQPLPLVAIYDGVAFWCPGPARRPGLSCSGGGSPDRTGSRESR
jgi:Uma2 family endonuclease